MILTKYYTDTKRNIRKEQSKFIIVLYNNIIGIIDYFKVLVRGEILC